MRTPLPHLPYSMAFLSCCIACLMSLDDAEGQAPAARRWIDSQGRALDATLVEVKGNSVVVRRTSDNREFTLSLPLLSAQDQAWIKSLPPDALKAARPWNADLTAFRSQFGALLWKIYQRQSPGKPSEAEKTAWDKAVASYEKKQVRWEVHFTSYEKDNQFEIMVTSTFGYRPGKPGDGTVNFQETTANPVRPPDGSAVLDHPIAVRVVPSGGARQQWGALKPGPVILTGTIDSFQMLAPPVFDKNPGARTILVTVKNAAPES